MMTMLTEVTRAFRAMNTDINAAVCVSGDDTAAATAALDAVEALFRDAEASFSRFLPDSELVALNRGVGRPFAASRELYDIVEAALDFAVRTGGRFDVTILPDLVAAGYDRSFEALFPRPGTATAPARRADRRQVRLDPERRTITLPEGIRIDLGGLAKGRTADRAAAGLRGFAGSVIDAGGDIVVTGTQANGEPWTIGIADPFDDGRDLGVLSLSSGAVCTSSTVKRRWRSGDRTAHHIIDPRTGRPARSGVAAATVQAPTAAEAEVLAKTAVIMGERDALGFIAAWRGARGLLVLDNGAVRYTDGFAFS